MWFFAFFGGLDFADAGGAETSLGGGGGALPGIGGCRWDVGPVAGEDESMVAALLGARDEGLLDESVFAAEDLDATLGGRILESCRCKDVVDPAREDAEV